MKPTLIACIALLCFSYVLTAPAPTVVLAPATLTVSAGTAALATAGLGLAAVKGGVIGILAANAANNRKKSSKQG